MKFVLNLSIMILIASAVLADPTPQKPKAAAEKERSEKANPKKAKPAAVPSDPDDTTVWPNRASHANSDPWLAKNHDRLRVMRPRVLVINFSNEHSPEHVRQLTDQIIFGLSEGSRWHGYADKKAPAFLQYQVVKIADLRDADQKTGDSRLVPAKPPEPGTGNLQFRYAALFDDEFAARYGFADPDHAGKLLTLAQLVDRGIVHEVWVAISGNTQQERQVGMWEAIELKAAYTPDFKKIPGKNIHCGNGSDPEQPWSGRSLKIGCINASRGPGCFLESLSHSFEGMCRSEAIPYIRPYFAEYGGFDLETRYKLPFDSFYAADLRDRKIEYPDPHTALVPHGDKVIRVENYEAVGGNVHFTPNGRSHYDLTNPAPVMSTIEDWRMGSGPGGRDRAKPWSVETFKAYEKDHCDCMGPWLVYWRQNMPGLDNKAKDDHGRPMKNWWPFLFY
jgi:hypothetical protein